MKLGDILDQADWADAVALLIVDEFDGFAGNERIQRRSASYGEARVGGFHAILKQLNFAGTFGPWIRRASSQLADSAIHQLSGPTLEAQSPFRVAGLRSSQRGGTIFSVFRAGGPHQVHVFPDVEFGLIDNALDPEIQNDAGGVPDHASLHRSEC